LHVFKKMCINDTIDEELGRNMNTITSTQNAKVKQWLKYHNRKHRLQDDVFLIEGEHLVEEAYKANHLIELWISETCDATYQDIPTFVSPQHILDKLSMVQSSNTMIGLCKIPHFKVEAKNRIFLCDNIQDPGNLGTIIRSALAFNFDAIYCSKDTVDFTNEKVVRSTQGALFQIPIHVVDLKATITQLKQESIEIVALALTQNAVSHVSASSNMAFILGNEGQGISTEILELADHQLVIPISNIDSLNVAITAGIIAYNYQNKEHA